MGRDVKVISILAFLFIFMFLSAALSEVTSEEPEQTISGFHLSGFGKEGSMKWEIFGESADIFQDEIRLNDFVGTLYGQEKIVVTANRGNFNKGQNQVHLEKNVVINTESGAELTTDYLDWNRDTAEIKNEAAVDIRKDNIIVTGVGINGDTNLRKMDLKKDVKVEIDNNKNRIVITSSGPLSMSYADNIAVFNNDVVVDDGESKMYADLMEVFFDSGGSGIKTGTFSGNVGSIQKIIARGNVKIVRQDNVSFSNEAVYNAKDKTLSLTGRPKLVIYSAEELDASIGN